MNLTQRSQEVRIDTLVRVGQDMYKRNHAAIDARNLAYYRGEFWTGDGHAQNAIADATAGNLVADYRAQQNEVFPAIDTITSGLALDVPQVECIDARVLSYRTPTRMEDATFVGRRIAAPLNLWAEDDDLDDTVALLVLGANVFRRGGLVKTSWSSEFQRVIWRYKLPWQVFQDPTKSNIRDADWIFELFPLHIDDLKARLKARTYTITTPIQPDTLPRDLIADYLTDEDRANIEAGGLKDTVSMVEFWDFRTGELIHYHPATKQVLMRVPIPWGNPYDQLIFSPALGQPAGISTVDIMASGQRDVNELVSARRQIVELLAPKIGVNTNWFPDDDAYNNFLKATVTTPFRFKPPAMGANAGDPFVVSPAPQTTFDFNKHLQEQAEHGRYAVGISAMDRSQVVNIRTAAEADAVRGMGEGRANVRARKTIKVVRRMFDTGLACMRWAVRNQEASRIDIRRLHALCVADVDVYTWVRELAYASVRFRVLPFSPLMEDRNTRRRGFETLLPMIEGTALAGEFDTRELAREIQESHGWRPSVLKAAAGGTPVAAPNAPPPPTAPAPAPDPMAAAAGGMAPAPDIGQALAAMAAPQ